MKELTLFTGKEKFYKDTHGQALESVLNTGFFDPMNKDNPVRDEALFRSAVSELIPAVNTDCQLNVVIPDIMLFSKTLIIEKLPLSLKKQQEVINWKLSTYLPADADRFNIQYSVSGSYITAFGFPLNSYASFTRIFKDVITGTWNLIPESVYFVNKTLNSNSGYSGIILINRNHYFTAAGITRGNLCFIRTRIKVPHIDMSSEIQTVKTILNEQVPDAGAQVESIGQPVPESYNHVKQEWE